MKIRTFFFLTLIKGCVEVRGFGIGDVHLGMGKQIKLERIAQCPGTENKSVMALIVDKITTSGNMIYANATIVVKQDIQGQMDGVVNVQRCRSKENLDSCEGFHELRSEGMCKITKDLFESMHADIRPSWKCPPKKGRYVVKNAVMDISPVYVLPVDGSYYTIKTVLRSRQTGRFIFCYLQEGTLVYNSRTQK